MIKISSLLLLLFSFPAHAGQLELSISNVMDHTGELVIRVYDNEKNWLSTTQSDTVKTLILPVKEHTKTTIPVSIELKEGNYAISVLQDLDGDMRLRKSWIGKPQEPVGNSGNSKDLKGPPSFKQAMFSFNKENPTLEISLQNYD